MEGAPLASAGAPRLSGEGTWGLSEAECQQRPGLDHARWGAGVGCRGGPGRIRAGAPVPPAMQRWTQRSRNVRDWLRQHAVTTGPALPLACTLCEARPARRGDRPLGAALTQGRVRAVANSPSLARLGGPWGTVREQFPLPPRFLGSGEAACLVLSPRS